MREIGSIKSLVTKVLKTQIIKQLVWAQRWEHKQGLLSKVQLS